MSNRTAFIIIAFTLTTVALLAVASPPTRIVIVMMALLLYGGVLLGFNIVIWLRLLAWLRRHSAPIIAFCFLISAIIYSPDTVMPYRVPVATLFALLGMVGLIGVVRASWWHDVLPTWATRTAPLMWRATPIRWHWVLVALALWAVAMLQSVERWLPIDVALLHHGQHVAWAGGFVALAWATRNGERVQRRLTRQPSWLLVVAILLVAFAVRVGGVDDILRVPIDETIFMSGASTFRDYRDVPLFEPMSLVASVPRLYSYWVYLTSEMGGYNWFGLRLASIFIGMLSLPVIYLLARLLFNQRVALMALAIAAIFPPHVHFSRTAMIQIADVLAGSLALLFMARAARMGRARDALWAGVFLGTTQLFYDAGRWLFLGLAILWWGRLLLLPMKDGGRRWWHSLYVGVGFVVAALPAYIGFAAVRIPATNRAEVMMMPREYWAQVVRDGQAFVGYAERLLESIGRYVAIGEIPLNILQYDGQHPLVLEVFLPFFLMGVGVLLWRWRSPISFLLLAWLGGTAFGSSLLLNHASDSRYVVTFPALVLLVALGMDGFVQGFSWHWLQHAPRIKRGLAAALISVLGAVAMVYYFVELLPNLNVQVATYNYDGTDAVWRARELPEDALLVFIAAPRVDAGYRAAEMRYFGANRLLLSYDRREWDRLLDDVLPNQPIAFFVAAEDTQTPEMLGHFFDLQAAQPSPATHLPPHYFLTLYYAPEGLVR